MIPHSSQGFPQALFGLGIRASYQLCAIRMPDVFRTENFLRSWSLHVKWAVRHLHLSLSGKGYCTLASLS